MPVTKTAKRALKVSKNKNQINRRVVNKLDIAVRKAKKSKKSEDIKTAISIADRASKRGIIHKNKSSRIKSSLAKLAKLTPSKAAKSKKKK